MNDYEMKEAFEQMLENIDARMFLKASPLESGERSKLDKALSHDMYYNSLYANSERADNLIKEIRDKIVAEDTHNFVLSGYKGCGKSTFVGYFLRNIDARNLVIRFDDHWEPREGILQNIVMFLYEKIYHDILPVNGEEACRISDKYVEIYNNKMNGDYIESNVDLHDYFTFFIHKLIYTVRVRRDNPYDEEKVKVALRDHIKAHIKSGSISNLMILLVFWDIADRIVHQSNPKCCIVFENLDVIHNTEDVPELVQNVVAFRNNIDKITESIYYKGHHISDPTQDYILIFVMRETTKAEFSHSIDHFSDKKIRFHHFMAVSEIYDLYDIIMTRYRYLESIKDHFPENSKFYEMMNSIKNIIIILKSPAVRKKIFAIFNNDYRTCIEALEQFGFSDSKILNAHNQIIRVTEHDDDWSIFASRSIIFRHIFNRFVKDVFFKMVRKYEYSISDNGQIRSVNLDRMILLYLNNSQNILVSEEMREKEYVQLNVLYLEILKFCKKPETIVEAIWNMYDLQNTEMWNHLVTFDDMQNISLDELQQEMDAVIQKKENVHYAKIKITLSGQVYLNNILPHFEYYAARSQMGKGYSLFCSSAIELCNIHEIEKKIKQERKEVVDCCKRLYLFFTDVFDKIPEFKGKNFLNTNFVSMKVSESRNSVSRMYHCEKIVYSNIGYLDRFRFFVFYLLDEVERNGGFDVDVDITDFVSKITNCNREFKENLPKEFFENISKRIILKQKSETQIAEVCQKNGEKKSYIVSLNIVVKMIKICYNKSIVDNIIELMKLFGFRNGHQSTVYSEGTIRICQLFDGCIDYKIIPSKYEDFYTHITVEDGEKICAEVNRKNRQVKQEQRRQRNIERRNERYLD